MKTFKQFIVEKPYVQWPKEDWDTEAKASHTDNPAFHKWFGHSKVVTAAGTPLIVYHGTKYGQDIAAFDTRRDKRANRMGTYFTHSPQIASRIRGGAKQVVPVYLRIEKPMDLLRVERVDIAKACGFGEDIQFEMKTQGYVGPYATLEWLDKKYDLVPRLKRKGYDGIVFDGDVEGDTYVVFSPLQIKSIYNNGSFDSASPMMSESTSTIFETGKPVTFEYIRYNNKTPNMGTIFGQHIEPAGRYIRLKPTVFDRDNFPDVEVGTVTFDSPLVMEWGDGYSEPTSWKRVLSDQYGGKKGRTLSMAILRAGYDGIVTVDKYGHNEIIDLTVFK